jgi:hypothetical protein
LPRRARGTSSYAESQVRNRLSAGGSRIRTIGSADMTKVSEPAHVASAGFRANRSAARMRGDTALAPPAGPMVRILFPPAGSLLRTPIEPGADPRSKSASSTARFKHDGGRDADRFHRKPVGDEHGGDVRQHHAERCADDDRIEGREPRGEADRGDLGLVTDFGEEKSAKGCHECTCASGHRPHTCLETAPTRRHLGMKLRGPSAPTGR